MRPMIVGAGLAASFTLMSTTSALADAPAAAGVAQPTLARAARTLTLDVGGSQMIEPDRPVDSVVNSNGKVLQVVVQSRRSLVLFGQIEGRSELRLLDKEGALIDAVDVIVAPNEAALQGAMADTVGPGAHVRRVGASVVLTGWVETAADVALAADLAQKAGGSGVTVINLLKSRLSDQITVSVRVLEVKRSKLRSVGVRWATVNNSSAKGANQIGNVFATTALARPTDAFSLALSTTFRVGKTMVDAYLDLLRTEGDAKLLAEPSIVATSGKPAKFLAGGEYPVPVLNTYGASVTSTAAGGTGGGANTFGGIYYKQYGISLNFTATMLPDGRVDLQVAPEVSSIDRVNAIEYGGNRVPALATRRAETDLRLNSGDAVVFAGLTLRNTDHSRSRFPVGNLPVLDFFSGPSSDSADDTELVIVVSPQIGAAVAVGDDGRAAASLPSLAPAPAPTPATTRGTR